MAAVEKEKTAEANRTKFGRTKADKQREKLEREQRDRTHDWHRRDEDE